MDRLIGPIVLQTHEIKERWQPEKGLVLKGGLRKHLSEDRKWKKQTED